MTVHEFSIDVDTHVITDLLDRVRASRFTTASGATPFSSGVDPDYLRSLTGYWGAGFDWEARQLELNELPHRVAEVVDTRMHFLHFRAEGADASTRALLLSHGWPSSFIEMVPLAQRLSSPSRFGSAGAEAFDVVVPSLPGFLFSDLPAEPLTRAAIARLLHGLMTDVLGYERFGVFGGDIGGAANGWIAAQHPESVIGMHGIHGTFPAVFDPPPTDAEQRFLDAEETYDESDGGYSAIMSTRPDTIAAALADSPVGLAAWIIDKYRDWSDCHGDVESRFDRDTLLTIITLYWATNSIGSSFRQYLDYPHNGPRPTIVVPSGFTISAEPLMAGYPRSIAERACSDIRFWNEPGTGGHFLAFEEPDRVATDTREFFARL